MNISSLTSDFAKVMNYPDDREQLHIFDFTGGYEPGEISQNKWGIGRYNEKRKGMYLAPQYDNKRNIHMGIDIWAGDGEPVFSFYEGEVAYKRDNNRQGDYGPTIVARYNLSGTTVFGLYGHLSRSSLERVSVGQELQKGEQLGQLGPQEENGGWPPHLHFQLSIEDPGEADMPGVVAEWDREQALERYPDPRLVLGDLY